MIRSGRGVSYAQSVPRPVHDRSCALKAIRSTAPGQSTVWWLNQRLAKTNTIAWQASCGGYVLRSDGMISAQYCVPMDHGQVLTVVAAGSFSVTGGGVADGISVVNNSTTPYTTGLAATDGGMAWPIAAFPFFGNTMGAFAPVERVLLMFTNYPTSMAAPLTRTYAAALLVDMQSAAQRAVAYDFDTGWKWDGGPWRTSFRRTRRWRRC